jgi:hypothetical protein
MAGFSPAIRFIPIEKIGMSAPIGFIEQGQCFDSEMVRGDTNHGVRKKRCGFALV